MIDEWQLGQRHRPLATCRLANQLFAPQAHPVNPMVQGVLTKIRNGHRTNTDVPFPAGIALDGHGNLFVSAFSIAPDTGLGVPNTSGQVWRLRS